MRPSSQRFISMCRYCRIIHNGKVVAHGTPTNLIQNIEAKNAYFGDHLKLVNQYCE